MWYKVKRIMMIGDNDMRWPSPYGFHVPLSTELQAIYDMYTWLWLSWVNDFCKYLKLPPSWDIKWDWSYEDNKNNVWLYWASSYYNSWNWRCMLFNKSANTILPNHGIRVAYWCSIRPFKNYQTIPTSSWAKLYWTSIESWWIFWSATDWLISISSNWTNWITIQDKNLWATTVYNYWDTLNEANCGYFYQWGNNYGFPYDWIFTKSTTQVDASNYWPWNYYSSSTFINTSLWWDSSKNTNLRWWVSQWGWEKQIRPTKLPLAYQEVEYIESSWTQRIDTWVIPTQNTISQIKFRNLAYTWDVIYWMYNWSDSTDYRFFNASTYAFFDMWSGRINNSTSNTIAVWTDYELELWNFYVKNLSIWTNILSWTAQWSYTWWRTITLNNYNNSTYSQNRWYYVKIRDWQTLVRDFVPCYSKSDNVIWMYDLVNDQFYINSWTWTFTKWPNV